MIALLTRLSLIISLACLVSGELTSQAPAEKRIDFNRDVRPILAGHC